MKNDKDIEQILLNDEKYEKFIRQKTEQEFNKIVDSTKLNSKQIISDISKVPKGKLFSKEAVYLVINKASKTKSYINGIQAEAYLVSPYEREKFLSGVTESFVYQDNYIKFCKYKKAD